MRVEKVELLTNGSGAAAADTLEVQGEVVQVRYVPDGEDVIATGATLTVAGKTTGAAILTQANLGTTARQWAPRQPSHAIADGAAAVYTSDDEPVLVPVAVAKERLTVTIASGDEAKRGTVYLWIR